MVKTRFLLIYYSPTTVFETAKQPRKNKKTAETEKNKNPQSPQNPQNKKIQKPEKQKRPAEIFRELFTHFDSFNFLKKSHR